MMQKTIAAYIGTKIKDEIFAPPPSARDEVDEQAYQHYDDPLDGELIRDDEGRTLGRAQRVHAAAVYVVSGSNVDPDEELERALNDPETETIIHWQGDQIAALVFVPSQSRYGGGGSSAVRADDV